MFGFARDDKLAELLREATAFKDQKDWDAALKALAEAKRLMLVSPVCYPAETWCKYPLYLQQAGRYEEAMAEFQFLLADLERRARRDARLDDPSVGPRRQKMVYYKGLIRNDMRVIKEKMALAQSRQKKAEAKHNPNLKHENAQQPNPADAD
jgi:tetratricopeptide (TPR) repeat protein